jgi:hypothetical protein
VYTHWGNNWLISGGRIHNDSGLPFTLQCIFLVKIGKWVDQNCHHHGQMAHHFEIHFSQIAPLGFETTIDDNETSLAALVLILFVLFI